MTYRERIAISKRRIVLAIYGCVGLIVIGGLLISGKVIPETSFFVVFLLILPVAWFARYGIRCPRCNENLSHTVFPVGGPFSISNKIKVCPYCAVALDTEVGSNEKQGLTTGSRRTR